MAKVEREREILSEPLSAELLQRRRADGWRAAAIVWERRVSREIPEPRSEAVPYGLQVAADCDRLEKNEAEIETMRLMLKLIVDEVPFPEVARRLNERDHRTRGGERWTATTVFRMLPRLIEVAPTIYSSSEWLAMKPSLEEAV